MADKYTYADIIIDPNDPRLKGALDEKCYAGETPAMTLNFANKGIEEGLFIDMNAESFRPFKISYGKIIDYYPAIIIKKDQPQKSYEERQAEWIKENDIKVGDKVRTIRIWTNEEAKREGCVPRNHVSNDIVGSVGKILKIRSMGINIDHKGVCWCLPYFVLEKVTKKYVPFDFSKEEDRNMCKGRWVRSKNPDVFHEFAITQFVRMNNKNQDIKVKASNECTYFAEELLADYEFLDGTPVGKEVWE